MKYIFVHFGPEKRRTYVNGFLSFINGTDEEVLADIEKQLKVSISNSSKDNNNYVNTTELLYSIQNPNELNSKGEALVRIEDFNHTSIKVGYWLEDIKTGGHLVNL